MVLKTEKQLRLNLHPPKRRWQESLCLLVALIIALLSWIQPEMWDPLHQPIDDRLAPLRAHLQAPALALRQEWRLLALRRDMAQENLRLKQENERLLRWRFQAEALHQRETVLREMLHLRPAAPEHYLSAVVLHEGDGQFRDSLVLDQGCGDGVITGMAALASGGLIGHIFSCGEQTSRLLLLQDLNSRIPVRLAQSRVTAILRGQGSNRLPRLEFLPPATSVETGELLVTSGLDGIFPPDIPIGHVAHQLGETVFIQPIAHPKTLEYVLLTARAPAETESPVPPPEEMK